MKAIPTEEIRRMSNTDKVGAEVRNVAPTMPSLGPVPRKRGLRLFLSGIASRVTQLSWAVTLATLFIFIAFIIPEQERELQQGLESKGHAIAVALQGEVAGAAITEDYSAVVEHAMQVVAGDPDVQFLVIAKNDGYAILIQRQGWNVIPMIAKEWRSDVRTSSSTIGLVPLVGQRLFHYANPFDYSGIPWGWVHVGLSLETYDRSVRDAYVRTSILGIVCITLSLFASIVFAQRFVKPILGLRAAMDTFAQGNMEVRAHIATNDEIEQLAGAFNELADAVLQRDQIVESVRFVAQALQEADEWHSVAEKVLALIGQATKVSRVILVEVETSDSGRKVPRIRFEWAAQGIEKYGSLWGDKSVEELGLVARGKHLAEGHNLIEQSADLAAFPLPAPNPPPKSRVTAPVIAQGELWGALVIGDCFQDRKWRDVEQSSLRAIADMLGAFIVRQRNSTALMDAKNQLERRVEERTLELRDQIAAKDKAHSELQQMQKQLIELSRLSGMAEVANGVLHNVGNVLNSVNVSATLMIDHLKRSRVKQLGEISAMLSTKSTSLFDFLTTDPRGQRIVPYLAKLSVHLSDERELMKKECESLVQNVGHIKEIVAMQQGYARTYGVLEKVAPMELFEDALSITRSAMERHQIVLKKEIEPADPIITDRHKVLQILLNLLQNAKDAVKDGGVWPREIVVRVRPMLNGAVQFEVEDNGAGIAQENLTRIFSHGFTTKKTGHGFGLHSGALAAVQLGGALRVQSRGLGQGALFTLDLPFNAESANGPGGKL